MKKNKTLHIIIGLFSALYIANPTLGVFEFIPDNLPFIGNLDELGASALLIQAIRIVFGKRKPESIDDILDK
ncbi:MAG: hypothetical protein AB8B61_02950 [Cyclobacteriaceae bacterium]